MRKLFVTTVLVACMFLTTAVSAPSATAGHFTSGRIFISRATFFKDSKMLLVSFPQPIHHHGMICDKVLDTYIQHIALKFNNLRELVNFKNGNNIIVDEAISGTAIDNAWPLGDNCGFTTAESIISGKHREKIYFVSRLTIRVSTELERDNWIMGLTSAISDIRSAENKALQESGAGTIPLHLQ